MTYDYDGIAKRFFEEYPRSATYQDAIEAYSLGVRFASGSKSGFEEDPDFDIKAFRHAFRSARTDALPKGEVIFFNKYRHKKS
jgi:hypothetical protein